MFVDGDVAAAYAAQQIRSEVNGPRMLGVKQLIGRYGGGCRSNPLLDRQIVSPTKARPGR
jgi:hypothetical protein